MKLTSREMQRIAALIDRVVGDLDVRATDPAMRKVVRHEATHVLSELEGKETQGLRRLKASLERLVSLIDAPDAQANVTISPERNLLSLKTLVKAFAALTGGMMLALPTIAMAANVGDQVRHPQTNVTLTVIESAAMGVVAVDSNGIEYFIFSLPSVNSQIADPAAVPDANGNVSQTTTVLGYELSDGTRVTSYVLDGNGIPRSNDPATQGQLIDKIVYGTPASGTPGDIGYQGEVRNGALPYVQTLSEGDVDPTLPGETAVIGSGQNRIENVQRGSKGKNGRAGVFFVPASSGGAGGSGPNINQTYTRNDDITANGGPGILVASIGGNGGHGGGSYVNLAGGGKKGGQGGSGGDIDVTFQGSASVTTVGNEAHGIVVQSRAGRGGNGGESWGTTGSGGNGGSSNSGGDVTVVNNLDVSTSGDRSHGVFVQSLGGGAGDSGSSYGLFGAGGAAGWGGHGGDVNLTNNGDITTTGNGSYGILAQSIGGQGGDSGNVGGLAALGGYAGSGGNGGQVSVTTGEDSTIRTGGKGSHGIVAQSIGGGGGTGGVSGALVALGSAGGTGGHGNNVEVHHNGAIITTGESAYGILAQSIGGGGGSAGSTGGVVSLGGGGTAGGGAGTVDVTLYADASILTTKNGSAGIVAQSIGGGGGDGSNSGGLVSLGGKGGSAGAGSSVTVRSAGDITTLGIAADGIVAQSIGGGGGRGGSSGGFVSLGGSGNSGGNAASASAHNTGKIVTTGDLSRGMLVQSIGGGGGAAGLAGGAFAGGGAGGSGGNSGDVSIGSTSSLKSDGAAVLATNAGLIQTAGNLSSAIQAQSIGGGGGDGANAHGVFMALGGNGGGGGAGGNVTIRNTGSLLTSGNDAHGIFAQSIGGGGGNGGSTTASGVITAVAIGGAGAGGGNAGEVNIHQALLAANKSTISTEGDRAFGVLGQSIGGGGGNGGFSISTALSVGASVSVALGGSGAGGGNGGAVNYTGYADITTGTRTVLNDQDADPENDVVVLAGDNSIGLLLQSIGGGGGNGGFSIANSVTGVVGAAVSVGIGGDGAGGGLGGDVTLSDAGGDILTFGDFSSGLVAQSIGGGGGNGGYSIGTSVMGGLGAAVTVTVGGKGGGGGIGGVVDIDYTGDVQTQGHGSTGVLLQSISGGGGNGGFSVAAGIAGAAAPAITVGLGGSGGAGGAGNEVKGTLTGDISTFGDLATGYVAQSIGGGGGNAGYSVSGAVSGGLGGLGVAVGIGGTGGGGGAGGDVTVEVDGKIYTAGLQSSGFIAQSIGGGGGNGGFNVSGTVAGGIGAGAISVGLGGNGGAGGIGGTVRGTVTDLIYTKGDLSNGFIAQSIGGGGGSGGFNVSGSIGGGVGAGAISVGLGGFGEQGGNGGAVYGNAANILTEGLGATGYLVQSVGGAGGSGGFNVSGGIAGGVGSGAVTVGIGGFGAGGGDGNLAKGTINGTVETLGDLASAIVVQSLGGGGGSGGYNVSGGISGGVGGGAISVGLGGFGAGGGDGGRVEFNQIGNALTAGLAAKAVVLQSVGGGGGDGGFNVTGGIAGGVGSGTIGFGLGGSGGGGGDGGEVEADITGNIHTKGTLASGVLAQSVGGGGGSGGFNVTGGVAGGLGSGTINVGLGGSGAGGGDGDAVTLTLKGNALTEGLLSNAIVLQSLGGGGGDGGFSVAGGIGGGLGTGSINVSLGGNAGVGGVGGNVKGDITGTVETMKAMSSAIIAQSVGGGGGAGGFSVAGGIAGAGYGSGAINVGLGGAGGGGGQAGEIDLDVVFGEIVEGLELAILTHEDMSMGIVAQSIGGGGGAGGFNVVGGIAGAGYGSGTINVGLGGTGGDGGDASLVDVNVTGAVVTKGDSSTGIVAQSVGGGGGAGGFNVVGGIAASSKGSGSIGVALGGAGGAGGDGGVVKLTHTAGANADGIELAVLTEGDDATGIVAQSIGGGGGTGGFNINGNIGVAGEGGGAVGVGLGGFGGDGGDANTVTVDIAGLVQTSGDNSRGVVAQSIGGGGGDGGMNITGNVGGGKSGGGALTVGIGGFGAGGGDAGNVILTATGGQDAEGKQFAGLTAGDNATAFVAQSIGGGGGAGGMSIAGSVSGSKTGAGSVTVGLGGGAGAGGDAGTVQADLTGFIGTSGRYSGAVLAQSVGGGGGTGGMNISAGISASKDGAGTATVGIGGAGGAGGDGKTVKGLVRSDIQTLGDDSYGLTYQSIGGGGGTGGMNISAGVAIGKTGAGNVTFGMGGFGGDGGSAGLVDLDFQGSIQTQGDFAYGILAQSLGGGGGAGGMNISGGLAASKENAGNLVIGIGGMGGGGGNADKVKALLDGDVLTLGDEAYGALLQSLGGGGGAGGMNITGAVSLTAADGMNGSLAVGVGGFAGGGGDGDTVTGTVTGDYLTKGDGAFAVAAQSIGGGGGAGGMNITGNVAIGKGDVATASLGLGGFGGDGGNASDVKLDRIGDTQTMGANADAILIQSIGGSGGNGAISITGSLAGTAGETATGLTLGVGGFGGGGGDAGKVTGKINGNVWASGLDSDTRETIIDADGKASIARQRLGGSSGVVAQSIGGGGGNGGMNISAGLAVARPQSADTRAATIGVGGFAGGGGDADVVDLTIASITQDRIQIQANGDNRSAVIAQSIGGGGGNGGINVSGSVSLDGQLTVGIGGFGGDGGNAEDVTAKVSADLFAAGNMSRGLIAQSIGGGGGAGAMNFAAGIIADKHTSEPSLVFGLGGFGGAGGTSGDVRVNQDGNIFVEGQDAVGALVQSIAGGGGSGGLNVALSVSVADKKSAAISAGVGGSGGTGDDAGDVHFTSTGNILVGGQFVTNADDEVEYVSLANGLNGGGAGVMVQSIGGGGGTGGINVSGAVSRAGSPVAMGVGGSGGSGGNAGSVLVERGYELVLGELIEAPSLIRTFGNNTNGLVAQSIGGGGGDAGHNLVLGLKLSGEAENGNEVGILMAIGGDGAGAGSGDTVDVKHNGTIVTSGDMANGLIAQSIGGGGGNAAFNVGAALFNKANTAVNMAIGGGTGAAGRGDTVNVYHKGDILTEGDLARGIIAQSIGGGGGNVGLSMAVGIFANQSISVGLGRIGGTGGEGGEVVVDVDGNILTKGDGSDAILAQSIGGGGGTSGTISVSGSTRENGDSQSKGGSLSVGLEGGEAAVSSDVTVNFKGEILTRGDEARGIYAQSIGGGGGVGGGASATLFFSGSGAFMSVGGTGGEGAESGDVYINNHGLIRTLGDSSDGILAQAIGGGGGLGGSTRILAFQLSGSKGEAQNTALFAIGGTGGEGAIGGQVFVDNFGTILTEGDKAFGIRAQSIGGGGGIGGAALAGTIQGPAENNSVEINIGGMGGEGGRGDLVEVNNTGLIYTKGDGASGISANSIGGGGGDGGVVLSITALAVGGNVTNRLVTNIGGMGGQGGEGGQVIVNNTTVQGEEFSGVILTEGKEAHGILAQSIGGGGGNGSSVLTLQAGATSFDSMVTSMAIGGIGGSGNTAGVVDVTNGGEIYTKGEGAYGILAQSIGGGGGNGGLAIAATATFTPDADTPAAVAIGGFGGSGGEGSTVTVNNTGTIGTTGKNAHGIVAQSIGGGGGNANFGLAAGLDAGSAFVSNTLAAALGNIGGGSGNMGGEVIVNHSGNISVSGEGATAIKAESINGGGGSLVMGLYGLQGLPGAAYTHYLGVELPADPIIFTRVGAVGATSMNANKVTVNTTGTFFTNGANSVVDQVQSLAGGGGTLSLDSTVKALTHPDGQAIGFDVVLGGLNGVGNAASDIVSVHEGDMAARGAMATAILNQSIGGGGGRSVMTLEALEGAQLQRTNVTLGATNTTDETGGTIDRTQNGIVYTQNDFGIGSLLQSIGGGGGSSLVDLTGLNDGLSLQLGANGGSGADGSTVTANYQGGTETGGNSAVGLLLQSIGAGGGEVRQNGASSLSASLGGQDGVSGNGGAIDLTLSGPILTNGVRAHGLMLQSIGGGGGAVFGQHTQGTVNLSDDNAGDGGVIDFSTDEAILVRGAGSYGIIAQSLGGGGGWVDGLFAGSAGGQGAGGAITMDLGGIVYAVQQDSVGVFAQSLGADGAGDITITLGDQVRGGSGLGVGLRLDGGADNRIITQTSLSAVSGWAIQASAGNDHVVNNGLVVGNVDLGSGDNRFMNSEGATFLAFNTIDLRSSGLSPLSLSARSLAPMGAITEAGGEATFTNAGQFRLGLEAPSWSIDLAGGETFDNLDGMGAAEDNLYYGARVISTVDLDGHFVQTDTGRSTFDVAFGPYASDRVNVTGDAIVGGELAINLLWLENTNAVTLFSTGGSGTVTAAAPEGTLALNFSLKGDDAGVHLMVESDFGQSFLRPNEQRMGGHMDSALNEGGASGIGRLMSALGNMVAGQEDLYQSIFHELNPEGHVASMQTQYYGATSFANQMFDCGLTRETAIDRCVWGVGSTTAFDQEETGQYWGVTSRVFNARVGVEQRLNADWVASASAGYNSLSRQVVDRARMNTQGDGLDVGVGLRRDWNSQTDLSLTATAGWQWLESQRYGYVFDAMAARSEGENGYAQLGAELGYTTHAGGFTLRPAVSVLGTALRNGRYEEKGWDGMGARVLSRTQYIASIEPKVTMGYGFAPTQGVDAGFALTAGRAHRSEDGIYLPIQFIGAASSSDPAKITTPMDRSPWKLGFEAKVVTDSGVSFQAGYEGQLGEKADVHTGSVSVRWTF